MAEHVDEVYYKYVEVIVAKLTELLQQLVGAHRVVHLVVREFCSRPAVSFELRLYEWRFVEVFPLLFVLIDPQFRKHPCYLVWHQPAEDGVSCILRRCRQNAHI